MKTTIERKIEEFTTKELLVELVSRKTPIDILESALHLHPDIAHVNLISVSDLEKLELEKKESA